MKRLAAGGFKDITRIASSSPTMWQHICLKNKDNISQILASYIKYLEEVKSMIDSGDEQAIYDWFDSSRIYRNSLPGASSGPIKKALKYTVILLMKLVESQPLQQSSLRMVSVSRI
mgnify:CR=1 FL=1